MKTLAGLWIDRREALIVLVSPKGQETRRIESRVEKQLRRSGRSPSEASFEPQMVPADDSRERDYTGHLGNYYDEVISRLRPAEAIMVFGPGEAKGELRKRIERNKLDLRITCFETSDKMTERQILQKVRRHYSPVAAARPLGRASRRRVRHDRSPAPGPEPGFGGGMSSFWRKTRKNGCMAPILMYNHIKMKAKNADATKLLTITLKLPLLPGSLSTARSTCGKPQCPCHSDPARRHGLYYRWTGIINGRRTTRTISREQAQECRVRIKNYRLLQKIIARLLRQALQDAPWNQ